MNGKQIQRLMRASRVTIRRLAARMDITMKRVRYVRKHGLLQAHVIRDWIEGITGRDPGRISC